MSRGWILALCVLASCAAPSERNPRFYVLEDWPAECRVRVRGSSLTELIEKARPTALVSDRLLLWCTPSGDSSWTFELAMPFIVDQGGVDTWVLLDEPDRWLNSEFEGEFVSGRALYPTRRFPDGPHNHAERIGASKSWGELYKISCTHVPGGNHANQGTCVVLAWHRLDGTWQPRWEGYEATQWSMGSYGVDESYEFIVSQDLSMTIAVRHTYTTYPSFGGDNEPDPVLTLRRSGRLEGSTLVWETSWAYEAKPGETWERLAQKILFFRGAWDTEIPGLVVRLKDASGASATERLEPGRSVVLPPGFWP